MSCQTPIFTDEQACFCCKQNEQRCLRMSKTCKVLVYPSSLLKGLAAVKSQRGRRSRSAASGRYSEAEEEKATSNKVALQAAAVAPIAFLARRGCVATAAPLVTLGGQSDVQRTNGLRAVALKDCIFLLHLPAKSSSARCCL